LTPRADQPPTEQDGWSLQPYRDNDAAFLTSLLGQGEAPLLVGGIARTAPMLNAFLMSLLQPMLWALPTTCRLDGELKGVITNPKPLVHNLSSTVLPFFLGPREGLVPFRLYLAQLFWYLPLNRCSAQVPVVADSTAELFAAAGFKQEGVLRQHREVGGQRFDVLVFGMLRSDFEATISVDSAKR